MRQSSNLIPSERKAYHWKFYTTTNMIKQRVLLLYENNMFFCFSLSRSGETSTDDR